MHGVANYVEPVIVNNPAPVVSEDPNAVPELIGFESTSVSGSYKTGQVISIIALTNVVPKAGSIAFVQLNSGNRTLLTNPDGNNKRLIAKFTVAASDVTSELKVVRGLYKIINPAGSKTTQKVMNSIVAVPNNFGLNVIKFNQ